MPNKFTFCEKFYLLAGFRDGIYRSVLGYPFSVV
uniref:Uncharacterized protein n=1 Tax=viral metagenome TaxID=1070528 RepID=A0A6C0BN68_9ZZZZ